MEALVPRDARVLVGSPLRLNLVYFISLMKVACGGTVVPGANKIPNLVWCFKFDV